MGMLDNILPNYILAEDTAIGGDTVSASTWFKTFYLFHQRCRFDAQRGRVC